MCTKCKLELPIDEFQKVKPRQAGGYVVMSACKKCVYEYQKRLRSSKPKDPERKRIGFRSCPGCGVKKSNKVYLSIVRGPGHKRSGYREYHGKCDECRKARKVHFEILKETLPFRAKTAAPLKVRDSKKCARCKKDLPISNFKIVRCKNKLPIHSAYCIECNRSRSKEHRLNNLAKHKEWHRQSRLRNIEKVKMREKRWRENNREKVRELRRKWNTLNRESVAKRTLENFHKRMADPEYRKRFNEKIKIKERRQRQELTDYYLIRLLKKRHPRASSAELRSLIPAHKIQVLKLRISNLIRELQ